MDSDLTSNIHVILSILMSEAARSELKDGPAVQIRNSSEDMCDTAGVCVSDG